MQIQAPKGTKDVLPGESYKWQYIEKEMRDLCRLYGINELRTPIIEHTELFMRGVGDTTDIVQKEMYTFKDKGDRSITLKPEGTAGMVRAFLENRLFNEALPQKMYYLNAPVFRYEKPQAGRLREHHQFGVEFFGASSFEADAEIIMLALSLLRRLGLDELTLQDPEIIGKGGKFGVRLRASAPSLHLIRVDIQTEVSPVVGTEQQSEEMLRYFMEGFEQDPQKLWQSNLFGKPLSDLVREGLSNKLMHMPEDTQLKVQQTLEKIINEGNGGMVCILL